MAARIKSRQKLFDLAYRGLHAQGWVKSESFGQCLYRGPNGLKCAIGHCMSDRAYNPDLENLSPSNNMVRDAVGISIKNEAYACDLQNCHDSAETPEQMKNHFHMLAKVWDLQIPEVA